MDIFYYLQKYDIENIYHKDHIRYLLQELKEDNLLDEFLNDTKIQIEFIDSIIVNDVMNYYSNYLLKHFGENINNELLNIILKKLFTYQLYDTIKDYIFEHNSVTDMNIFRNFIKKDNDIEIFKTLYSLYEKKLDFYDDNGKWLQVLLMHSNVCLPEIKKILKKYYIDKNIPIDDINLILILYSVNKTELLEFLNNNGITTFSFTIDKHTVLTIIKLFNSELLEKIMINELSLIEILSNYDNFKYILDNLEKNNLLYEFYNKYYYFLPKILVLEDNRETIIYYIEKLIDYNQIYNTLDKDKLDSYILYVYSNLIDVYRYDIIIDIIDRLHNKIDLNELMSNRFTYIDFDVNPKNSNVKEYIENVFMYILDNYESKINIYNNIIYVLAKYGYKNKLQYILEKYYDNKKIIDIKYLYYQSLFSGDINTIEFIFNKYNNELINIDIHDLLYYTLKTDNMLILNYILYKYNIDNKYFMNKDIIRYILLHNNIKIVNLLISIFNKYKEDVYKINYNIYKAISQFNDLIDYRVKDQLKKNRPDVYRLLNNIGIN